MLRVMGNIGDNIAPIPNNPQRGMCAR
jgi:hypothetical protein